MNTVNVTLQDVQALYHLLFMQELDNSIKVGTIFLPLALLGLARLPSALWVPPTPAIVPTQATRGSVPIPLVMFLGFPNLMNDFLRVRYSNEDLYNV